MKDRALVEKRLTHVADCVAQLRRLAQPDRIAVDPVQRAFVEHTLQTAIQAVLDVASVFVAEHRLGEPKTNSEMFDLLAQHGFVAQEKLAVYHRMVGFRNIVVHGYLDVDPQVVRAIVEKHLDDLLDFVRSIRNALPDRAEP